ncbi:hypothetical protein ACOI1H_02475 [Loktanella sp. DJP18]|uniref:hypothetical protein n=1 Tax=Loktanella sp. DJP18 TaxID=3409788 RepID=UPI003BB647DC
MTRRLPLVVIWAMACVVAIAAALGALIVMIPDGAITYATELPATTYTTPMIAVIVFWGIVRACGVPLEPMRTFVLGALAVYAVLYLVGRIMAVTGFSPLLVWVLNLLVLLALAWWAVAAAGRGRP